MMKDRLNVDAIRLYSPGHNPVSSFYLHNPTNRAGGPHDTYNDYQQDQDMFQE